MKAALIAAGFGERLRDAGITTPKPLVPIAGTPLIDRVFAALAAVGIREVACIFNEAFDAVEAHCRQHPHGLELTIVRRTTPNSLESLLTLAPYVSDDRFLLLTVDAVFGPAMLPAFLQRADEFEAADGVLAVTNFVDDEKPLRIALDPAGRVTALGSAAEASPLVTAGFYLLTPRIFAAVDGARQQHLAALRQFLGHLVERGYRLYGADVAKTVDVDRPEDIAVAEAFVRSGYTA